MRLAGARRIADGRRVLATAIEARLGTRFTIDTVRVLLRRFPRVRFVWLMGADILSQLPRWRRWQDMLRRIPVAVLPRPGYTRRALAGRAAQRMRHARRPEREAAMLPGDAPGWVLLTAPQNAVSATAIRAAWTKEPCHSQTVATRVTGASQADCRASGPKPPMPAADKTPGTPRKKTIAAGPKAAPRARRKVAEPSALEQLQSVIVGSLDDDKAENVVTLDLEGKAMFCDRMVIATGLADRQIAAMAQHLSEKLHQAGLKRVQVEGKGGSDWVLIDAGDIVVHLFKPEARSMYALEKMWGADLDD